MYKKKKKIEKKQGKRKLFDIKRVDDDSKVKRSNKIK